MTELVDMIPRHLPVWRNIFIELGRRRKREELLQASSSRERLSIARGREFGEALREDIAGMERRAGQ